MPKIISLLNQKGGVGKTTTCINLATSLARQKKNVLVIDMDAQANTSKGINIFTKKNTIYDVLVMGVPMSDCIHKTDYGFQVVPSWIKLANANLEIASVVGRESLLKEAVDTYIENYELDYILIDCSPSLELLTLNCLTASTDIIIPVVASEYAIDGIEDLLTTYRLIKRKLNSKLKIMGVLFNQVDNRTSLSKEYYKDLVNLFEKKVFETIIHQSVDITRTQKFRKPILYFNPDSRACNEYLSLAKELIERD